MRYDLHIHTKYSKPCGYLEPSTVLKLAKKRNLDGIAICDHDTIKGATVTKKLNKDRDFEVIIGYEKSTDMGDVLLYYPQEKIKSDDLFEVLDKAKEQGCVIVIPHPFRRIRYIDSMGFKAPLEKVRDRIHGIETFNGRNAFWMNWRANREADRLKLSKTGGSDAHYGVEVGRVYTVFEGDFRRALLRARTSIHGTTLFGSISGLYWALRSRAF